MEEFVEDGVSGRLVDFDDLDGAARVLRELIEDAPLRARLAQAGRGAARAMAASDYAAKLARRIEELA
jgi:glycosyltransferase involved in cell wall biosynthesis